MKRSGPLKRRTRLRSNAAKVQAWERKTMERRRTDPEHAKAMRSRLAKSRRDSSELELAKEACKARAAGLCEANWEGVCPPGAHRGQQAHHVILRSQGGPDQLWNLLFVCSKVHQHAHDVDRAGAEERGIIKRGGVIPTVP
ncbi:MAG: hypothetical protein SHS37scaffold145_31 [Phage 71_18]|nr:MAG: hypothetical protein SHS37scaffold145_31 [Phage 71_18]